jgi:hypothetical protein
MSKKDELLGMNEVEAHCGGLATVTILDLWKHYNFPIEKIGGIWCSTRTRLDAWAAENGVAVWGRIPIPRLEAARQRKLRQGPGEILQGDMDEMCAKLDIAAGSFIYFLQYTNCPIKRLEGTNQFSVDINRWKDFRSDLEALPRQSGLGEWH